MYAISLKIALFLLIFISQQSYANDSLAVDQNYKVSIEQKELFIDFSQDTISVEINSSTKQLKGFALKIAVQTQYFNIDEIIPADFFDECGWEFFHTKQIITDFSAENYLQVWQIIGLSEIIPDSINPICYTSEIKKPLAKIIISRNSFTRLNDTIIPIFFLWEDCADNTISGMSGNELFVSDKIYQYYSNQPQFQKNQFPTTFGIPATCTKASALNSPVANIDFLNGGVILKDRD